MGKIILILILEIIERFPIFIPILIVGVLSVLSVLIICGVINNLPENRRKNALGNARLYLSPYKSIWNDLKLSNKYCSVELTKRKKIIIKNAQLVFDDINAVTYRIKYLKDNRHWDGLCYEFNYFTTNDDVVIYFASLGYGIETIAMQDSNSVKGRISKAETSNDNRFSMQVLKTDNTNENLESDTNDNKIDINNASEVEITSLPGISIVMSKKIIKKREEIGGFKNVQEVFDFLNLKTHFETQLRNLICVKKMQGKIKIKRYTERKIDI